MRPAVTSRRALQRWEGKYFHHRAVNIWPRPYQEPHPPIWITALSPSSAREVGARGYIAACFLTGFEGTKLVFGSYRERRAELKLPEPALDRFAYAALVYVGETDEEGYAGARKLMWYLESNKVPPQFTSPPGYHPIASAVNAMKGTNPGIFKDVPEARARCAHAERPRLRRQPRLVYKQIMRMYDHVGGFGHLLIMGQAGFLDHDEIVKGMQMFVREIYPRLKQLA
jgi:alkanesulfonate monooxygenase SsuD/methylene tetrahydromethanopterin reductase-like flavin-dependent oxidoreductase (luciferase family)